MYKKNQSKRALRQDVGSKGEMKEILNGVLAVLCRGQIICDKIS